MSTSYIYVFICGYIQEYIKKYTEKAPKSCILTYVPKSSILMSMLIYIPKFSCLKRSLKLTRRDVGSYFIQATYMLIRPVYCSNLVFDTFAFISFLIS